MPVSHARIRVSASADDDVPGLLQVLRRWRTPRKRRGRRYRLVFVLAVAVVCVLAGARSFRELGDQAADLPQEVLAPAGRDAAPALADDHRAQRDAAAHLDPEPGRGRL
jgi:hypothetical protein